MTMPTGSPLADSLLGQAILDLPDGIRVDAVIEYRRWIVAHEQSALEAEFAPTPHPPAHELVEAEAARRSAAGDPTAPLWVAGAAAMRLRAETSQIEAQFTRTET